MTKSLWRIPNVLELRTPVSILKEQAEYLSSQTSGLLLGQISTTGTSDNRMISDLKIITPSLNRYTYNLLSYMHPVAFLYPGVLFSHLHDARIEIENEDNFMNQLSIIISSEETLRLISSLLSQATSA
jgi:hypothetical protein